MGMSAAHCQGIVREMSGNFRVSGEWSTGNVVTGHTTKGSVVFSIVTKFFLLLSAHTITHEPLHLVYFDNFYKPVEFQGHRSKGKVTWVFLHFCLHDTCWQYLALSEGSKWTEL